MPWAPPGKTFIARKRSHRAPPPSPPAPVKPPVHLLGVMILCPILEMGSWDLLMINMVFKAMASECYLPGRLAGARSFLKCQFFKNFDAPLDYFMRWALEEFCTGPTRRHGIWKGKKSFQIRTFVLMIMCTWVIPMVFSFLRVLYISYILYYGFL